MSQLIHLARSEVEILEESSKIILKGAGMAMEGISIGAIAQYEVIKINSDLVQQVSLWPLVECVVTKYLTLSNQVNTMLSSQTNPSIDDLLHATETLSFRIVSLHVLIMCPKIL